MDNKNFTHLHLHTQYSLLDGACVIDKLVKRVKSLGQTSVAITDHGVMFGVIDFYKAAKKEGIKPIIGCEVYVANRSRHDKVHKKDYSYHLVLLCENEIGYQNLIKMVSLGYVEGMYKKPRIDRELLEKYHEGLICLSGCLAGEIPRALVAGDKEKAIETALYYKNLFGKDRYYLELQDHGIREQRQILPELIDLAKSCDIPLVATNDAHYLEKEDSYMQKLLVYIQTGKTISSDDKMEFETSEFYVKSTQEMYELFDIIPEACENTNKIADMCNFDFEFGVTKLPAYTAPDNMDNTEYFKKLCFDGLKKHYGENPDKSIVERLNYEISVIDKMGYTNYFLIVFDFINYAKSQNIPVGPGRGSGAGSIAAYCVGITGIDPIKYNLLFERFLNPDRVSMPDFDVDFCYERRGEVIDYVVRKYGKDHVAQIITFGTMAARGAIRDVGRVMEIPYQNVDAVAKLVPNELKMTLSKALRVSKEFSAIYNSDKKIKELIDIAIKLEGMPRHSSTHAAGVVITPKPTDDYVPLSCNDGQVVTQFTMTTIEELGLLKMDFLGLRTLTVIKDAEKLVQKTIDADFDMDKISYEDKDVFKMLSNGDTSGVFQFESSGMRQVMVQLQPRDVEDLIAVISLYRPGPMDSIPTYINNRHHPDQITYKVEQLSHILDVTNGCIVYQEQVMQIFRELAGFSYGQADLVRRAMSKKKHEAMEKAGKDFIYGNTNEGEECKGCLANGISEKIAKEIFDEMSSFASYAFNKSHAAAYAMVSYQTAFLKCHYQKQYMAALLTSVLGNTDKIIEYTTECTRIGINILPPDINISEDGFTVHGENLRFGLLALKNVGKGLIDRVIQKRQEEKFTSFYDFCRRMHGTEINRRAIESFIKSGAMDNLGDNRNTMLKNLEPVLKIVEADAKNSIEGQINLFSFVEEEVSEFQLRQFPEYEQPVLLQMEKEISGLFLSGHPLQEYLEILKNSTCNNIKEFNAEENKKLDNTMVTLPCVIIKNKSLTTKSNQLMCFLTVEDLTGSMEVVVFPKVLTTYASKIVDNAIVVVKGRLSLKEDEPPKILAESIEKIEEFEVVKNKIAGTKKLYIKLPSMSSDKFEKCIDILKVFNGKYKAIFYLEDEKKYRNGPKDLYIDMNERMIKELKDLVGDKNIVMKEE